MALDRPEEEKAIAPPPGDGAGDGAGDAAGDALALSAAEPPITNMHRAQAATQRWTLAGLASLAVAMLVSFTGMLHLLPRPAESLAVFVCGWVTFALLSPRKQMAELERDDSATITLLASRAVAVAEGDRRLTLRDLVLEREDDLGRLSRALHDLAADARSNKQQARLMSRRLGHDVQRETSRATVHLQRQAMTDPLTGLGNRRALDWHAERLIARDGPQGLMSLLLVDVDRFKEINDTLGHGVGDHCLRFLADVMRSCLRDRDVIVRLGGDEFLAVMPGANLEAARQAAQRLLTLFAQMPWPHALQRATLSIGLAAGTSRDLLEGGSLLERTDAALYAAKRNGRATLAVFGDMINAA